MYSLRAPEFQTHVVFTYREVDIFYSAKNSSINLNIECMDTSYVKRESKKITSVIVYFEDWKVQ